jgi:adenylyl- and sulfurtransferase ThiI
LAEMTAWTKHVQTALCWIKLVNMVSSSTNTSLRSTASQSNFTLQRIFMQLQTSLSSHIQAWARSFIASVYRLTERELSCSSTNNRRDDAEPERVECEKTEQEMKDNFDIAWSEQTG